MDYRAAITTKYVGPSYVRGPRIIATCQAGRMIVGYTSGLSTSANHAQAAEKLARKWGWAGVYVAGGMPSGNGFVFVSVAISRDGMMPRIQGDAVAFTVDPEEANATQQANIARLAAKSRSALPASR